MENLNTLFISQDFNFNLYNIMNMNNLQGFDFNLFNIISINNSLEEDVNQIDDEIDFDPKLL